MWLKIVVAIVVGAICLVGVLALYLVTRTEKTPRQELRDLPSYREKMAFIQKVANYNLHIDAWTDGNAGVPIDLAEEARSILDKEKKESRLK